MAQTLCHTQGLGAHRSRGQDTPAIQNGDTSIKSGWPELVFNDLARLGSKSMKRGGLQRKGEATLGRAENLHFI